MGKVVVLSHKLWQMRYGGVGDIIGREILLDDEKYLRHRRHASRIPVYDQLHPFVGSFGARSGDVG